MRKPFKNWEKDLIRLAYPLIKNNDIAKLLKRDVRVINTYGSNLKLKKAPKVEIGQRFGKLIVQKETKLKKDKAWICICDCGKTMVTTTDTLNSGHSSSCGCGRIEAITKGNNIISGVWYGSIKKNAKKRKLQFDISLEYLSNLLQKQNFRCAISGLPIKILQGRRSKKTTASLDRIDNTKPYVEGNVQFLHKHVNYMKWTHNQDYFIKLCKKISKEQRIKNVKTSS